MVNVMSYSGIWVMCVSNFHTFWGYFMFHAWLLDLKVIFPTFWIMFSRKGWDFRAGNPCSDSNEIFTLTVNFFVVWYMYIFSRLNFLSSGLLNSNAAQILDNNFIWRFVYVYGIVNWRNPLHEKSKLPDKGGHCLLQWGPRKGILYKHCLGPRRSHWSNS
jgi:hypothetical protein